MQAREEGKADFLLVDVREDMEFNMEHIKGVDMLKPTSAFQQWAQELFNETKDEKTVVFTCRTGSRSGQVQNVFQTKWTYTCFKSFWWYCYLSWRNRKIICLRSSIFMVLHHAGKEINLHF